MSEKICSIILELPKQKQDYLKGTISGICVSHGLKTKDNLHMSIEAPFRCSSERFRTSLDSLLKMQSQFEIGLTRVDFFENSKDKLGLAFLTTDDEGEIEKLNDLHDIVEKIVGSKGRQFVPHVSLIDWAPINDVIDAGGYLQQRLRPVKILVSELSLQKKVTSDHWKNYGRFTLGEENIKISDFIQTRPYLVN